MQRGQSPAPYRIALTSVHRGHRRSLIRCPAAELDRLDISPQSRACSFHRGSGTTEIVVQWVVKDSQDHTLDLRWGTQSFRGVGKDSSSGKPSLAPEQSQETWSSLGRPIFRQAFGRERCPLLEGEYYAYGRMLITWCIACDRANAKPFLPTFANAFKELLRIRSRRPYPFRRWLA